MKRLGRNRIGVLILLVLLAALVAQLSFAQGSPQPQLASDTTDSDFDGDGVLDCAPGEMIHASAGFIGIGDPAATKTGALTNFLSDERRAPAIAATASDFFEHSVGESGGVSWVTRDRQVVVVLEQDTKRQWYAAARSMCTAVAPEE
jgi:hypothetical protein